MSVIEIKVDHGARKVWRSTQSQRNTPGCRNRRTPQLLWRTIFTVNLIFTSSTLKPVNWIYLQVVWFKCCGVLIKSWKFVFLVVSFIISWAITIPSTRPQRSRWPVLGWRNSSRAISPMEISKFWQVCYHLWLTIVVRKFCCYYDLIIIYDLQSLFVIFFAVITT